MSPWGCSVGGPSPEHWSEEGLRDVDFPGVRVFFCSRKSDTKKFEKFRQLSELEESFKFSTHFFLDHILAEKKKSFDLLSSS